MPGENRTFQRDCLVCGTTIEVTVNEDGTYEGGHYFGEITVPVNGADGEYQKIAKLNSHDVVKWTGKEESYEYWECEDCFR